jgi:hypothetical protein
MTEKIIVRGRGARGPAGATGPAGTGITILGTYSTLSALQAAHPTGNSGQGYLVVSDLYIWNPSTNAWINVGPVRGPKGDTGLTGTQGPAGPKGDKGDTGSTGLKGDKGDTGNTGTQGPKGDTGSQGAKGDKGDTGATGPQGPAGTLTNFDINLVSFVYEKRSNGNVWTIPHNLNFMPNVTVIDYGGNNVECDIQHVNSNSLTLTFSEAVSGHAYLS